MVQRAAYLTDEERGVLREVVSDYRRRPRNSRGVPLPPHLPTAPEVYVAAVPGGGIPARGGSVLTGAACNIYKVDTDGITLLSAGFQETVFNLSTTAIPVTTVYVKVSRDKYGVWFADAPPPPATTGMPFHNSSGETAPSYGVMFENTVTVISDTRYLDCSKPNQYFDIIWLVNEAVNIANDGVGYCDLLVDKVGPVRIDSSLAGSISAGVEMGPRPGSWTIWPNRRGFTTFSPDYTISGVNVVDCIQKPVLRVYGRLYSQLLQTVNGNSYAAFEIWNRNVSGYRVTAGWNLINIYAPLMQAGDKASPGTFAFADWMSNCWEGDPACDPDNTNSTQGSQQSASQGQDFFFSGPPTPTQTQ